MTGPFDATTWERYRRRWVAVKEGSVVADAETLAALYDKLPLDPEDYDLVAQVPNELYDFALWERSAREAHAEFKRRLRG